MWRSAVAPKNVAAAHRPFHGAARRSRRSRRCRGGGRRCRSGSNPPSARSPPPSRRGASTTSALYSIPAGEFSDPLVDIMWIIGNTSTGLDQPFRRRGIRSGVEDVASLPVVTTFICSAFGVAAQRRAFVPKARCRTAPLGGGACRPSNGRTHPGCHPGICNRPRAPAWRTLVPSMASAARMNSSQRRLPKVTITEGDDLPGVEPNRRPSAVAGSATPQLAGQVALGAAISTRAVEFEVQLVQERCRQTRLRGPSVSVSALCEPVDRAHVSAIRVAPRARGSLVGGDAGTAFDSRHEVFGGRWYQGPEPSATPQASAALTVDSEHESGGTVHSSMVTISAADTAGLEPPPLPSRRTFHRP